MVGRLVDRAGHGAKIIMGKISAAQTRPETIMGSTWGHVMTALIRMVQ